MGQIGVFSVSYRCAMAADAAELPDLPIVAFDFDPQTVDYMRQGRIKATQRWRGSREASRGARGGSAPRAPGRGTGAP
ncbi:hypothetical protein BE20_02735 [Sorangium cellulosum]|nr:hypothetical protein BE20_02735 [Sorangium cellulosum]